MRLSLLLQDTSPSFASGARSFLCTQFQELHHLI